MVTTTGTSPNPQQVFDRIREHFTQSTNPPPAVQTGSSQMRVYADRGVVRRGVEGIGVEAFRGWRFLHRPIRKTSTCLTVSLGVAGPGLAAENGVGRVVRA